MSHFQTPAQAVHTARRAPPAQRGNPTAHRAWSEGVALACQGLNAQALVLLQQATRTAPSVSLYWMNLASVQRRLRKPTDALASARRAFQLDPASELACQQLAELLRLNNRDAEALRTLRALDPATPRNAQHWLLEGAVLMALREWQDAAQSFLQVLGERPGDTEAYMQLGFALANLKRYADAAECFRTIALMEPDHFGASVYAAHYAAWACDWAQGDEDLQRLARALELSKSSGDETPFSPFCLLSMNDDADMHREAATLEGRRIAREARKNNAWTMPAHGAAGYPAAARALAAGRIRLGFVSADFRTHATSMLLVRTLERIDRARFEVVLYAHGPDDASPLRRRIEAAADRFVDCTEMNTLEQATRIHDDGIAVLVDMSGYTAATRLPVFALRPAPVQVLWLAYPSTIGSDFIDYIVGDPVLTPMAHQADFAEHIAQLPLCYEPTDERREHPPAPGRADCGLPEAGFVYACFNQSYKITEPVFTRWCRILHQVPGSVLWLLVPQVEIQAALHARAAERGIPAERVIFAPFVTPSEHLARLQCADLFLDTFPYGAHTTCSDALWMGLPVLTQVGRSFSSRVAASLLNAVGLPELAVAEEGDYETLAIRLAEDAEAYRDVRAHLVDHRMSLPLFDNARFTGELQDLFARMADRWRAGEPAQPLPAA